MDNMYTNEERKEIIENYIQECKEYIDSDYYKPYLFEDDWVHFDVSSDNYGRLIHCIYPKGIKFFVVIDNEITYIRNSIYEYPTYKEKQNKFRESIGLKSLT